MIISTKYSFRSRLITIDTMFFKRLATSLIDFYLFIFLREVLPSDKLHSFYVGYVLTCVENLSKLTYYGWTGLG